MKHSVEREICGRIMRLETGELAKQAEGAVLISYGNTVMLSTAVSSDRARPDASYFPLSVEVQEHFFSSGKIKGSRFIKREGRLSDWAILVARLTDRPLRPLFPKESRNDVQVIGSILAVDFETPPETLSIIGGSAALTVSKAPFMGPVAGVEVGYIDGKVVVNPTLLEREKSQMSLFVAGTKDGITMVEAGAKEVTEEVVVESLLEAHKVITQIVELQEELAQKVASDKKEFTQSILPDEIKQQVKDRFEEDIKRRIVENAEGKFEDGDMKTKHLFDDLYDQLDDMVTEDIGKGELESGLFSVIKASIRESILDHDTRPDGRGFTQVRPISTRVSVLPGVHGSGLFNRGGTQALTVATLGPLSNAQLIDLAHLKDQESKRYIHYYTALPYSVGESGRIFGPGRRAIGHGDLAERALSPVIPSSEEFPYALIVNSEVLGQNGSSSMASVCGSTLALMDAGVKIKAPVSGIAMGLVYKSEDNYKILTDIQAMEDFCGDMDFKVAGTEQGITALQMDIKIKNVSPELMKKALIQAREGRLNILEEMKKSLSAPRPELSKNAPRILSLQVNPSKIGKIIGSGGKTINGIIDKTGVQIDIEDSGLVMFSSKDAEQAEIAIQIVKDLTEDPTIGKIYPATVVKTMPFGAFVSIPSGVEGLVHISELDRSRVNNTEDVVKVGDHIQVKLLSIDDQGRLSFSKKQAEN